MKCYIGLGTNLGNAKENLDKAAQALQKISNQKIKISPVYKTPALLPENAPAEWNKPYLNTVIEIDWKESAGSLLTELKILEKELGRTIAPKWAPRLIDLDLLTFGNQIIQRSSLHIPHNQMTRRSFVLDPLKDLCSTLQLPNENQSVLHLARSLKTHCPLIMGILNVTPDSFSDGGETDHTRKIKEMDELGVQIIDIGAESTRPNAIPVTAEVEWLRLEPVLKFTNEYFKGRLIKPQISLDTYKASIAWRAQQICEINIINDVGGLSDPEMISVLQNSDSDYVLMHNLAVTSDPVLEIKEWFEKKIEVLTNKNIDINRVIFDIGIGFGKTAEQSLALIKRVEEFHDLPIRTLVGHSRKSFMTKLWGLTTLADRDASTLFLSKELAQKGIDILRIHNYHIHTKAFT